MTARSALWAAAIAAVVLLPSAFMYAVSTFLFAFSGGQYRMVTVVNDVALVVIATCFLAAAVTWRLRSGQAAILAAAISTVASWVAGVIVEWAVSFRLGA